MKLMHSLLLPLFCTLSAISLVGAQENEVDAGASSADQSQQTRPEGSQLQATLLMVNADWTLGEHADAIREQVNKILEGKPIPDEFREDPAKHASEIWFLDDHATIYEPEDFAAFVAWLYEHDLIHGIHHGEMAKNPYMIGVGRAAPAISTVELVVQPDIIPLPELPPKDASPLIQQSANWSWKASIAGIQPNQSTFQFNVAIDRKSFYSGTDQQNANRIVSTDLLSVFDAVASAPTDMMMVVPWYLDRSSNSRHVIDPPENIFPIVVIYHAPMHCPWLEEESNAHDPRLLLPTQIAPLSMRSGPQFNFSRSSGSRRGERGSRGAGTPFESARRGRSEPAEGSRPAAEATANEAGDEPLLQVYSLQYAEASDVMNTIDPLFPEPNVVMSIDSRANMLLVQAPTKTLKVIEALVMQLDVPAVHGEAPPTANNKATSPESIKQLRDHYQQLDRTTRDLAGQRNRELRNYGSNHPRVQQLRTELRTAVARAFTARQLLQRAEIEALRQELEELEKSVAVREQIEKEIIDRRVEELLELP